jgi:hypothetical protein
MPRKTKPVLERKLINIIPHYDDPKEKEKAEEEMRMYIYNCIHDKKKGSS